MPSRRAVLGIGVLVGAALARGRRAAATMELGTRDSVAIFSPFAVLDAGRGVYSMPVVAWIYEKENDHLRRAFLKQAERAARIADGGDEQRILRERLGAMLADNERGKTLVLGLGAQSITVGVSNEGGYVENVVALPAPAVEALQRVERGVTVFPMSYRAGSAAGEVVARVLAPEGLSVISDIDDTVKITEVLDREATFRNTFTREFRAVPGMPALYQVWQQRGAAFHYVSAGPWQVAQFLQPFLEKSGFPSGTMHMRPLRPRSPRSVKAFLEEGAADKQRRIEDLLRLLPGRRFILVGDSGEKDPETYGEVTRRNGKRIVQIYIRRVSGAANTAARFATAFAKLAPAQWTVFDDPAALKP